MSADTEMERKIYDFLRNGKRRALDIAKKFGLDKRTVNKHLYSLEKSNKVFKTNEVPPIWELMEKKDELKLTPKPEKKSQTTTETTEKDLEDLLKSGGLKAHEIAKDLGQTRQTINRQLYIMETKGKVKKCSTSKLWRLSDDSFSQDSDHGLDSVSGLSQSFVVIEKLGQGSFGCVYKVKHKYDGNDYAVKRVILDGTEEVKALARLDHPNIVRYITCWPGSDDWTSNQEKNQLSNKPGSSSDVVTFDRSGSEGGDDEDEDDNTTSEMERLAKPDSRTYLFIQMEFCEGGTLTNWIKAKNCVEKQRTIVEIHKILYEIITGVEFIHANKLIHRDLKPDNILFSANGKVKIGDFGLVAAQTDPNGDPIKRSKRRGTPPYRSPEQENKENYDEKTDIFPLGLIWFEMLWKISTGMERVKLWQDLRNQRFPEGFSDEYSAESTFIMKMLSYSPDDRPHAKDIKEDLQTFFSLENMDMLSQRTV
ncbi:interferon-induced, double-stranded RNA-activated protein kinase-like [Garra rufa]|uniref:interferon-induced, double-stranded RNA-activated protein kinase-like n=1 Tax=Garra rufa TaxID=137080 RepID=UPI003CCEB1A3